MYKWKKTMSFLMAVALLASSAPVSTAMNTDSLFAPSIQASAASRTNIDFDTGLEYVKYSGYAEITGYSSEDDGGELVIPDTLGGLPVTRIAKGAFTGEDSAKLTRITLPETIEYIGANAFAGCTNVTEGYIPSKFIGICAACKEIEVSENVTELVVFEVQDAHTTKVSTRDGLASLYTEYTLDGSSLAERGLAVPKKVQNADVSGLTAQNFKNFVKKYSTIEKVTVYNRDCVISDGLIPESAIISGYLGSTAQVYARSVNKTISNGLFIPLDGAASDEEILSASSVSFTYDDIDGTKKIRLTANADTGNYSVFEIGLLIDRNNVVTAETAESLLTLESDANLLVPTKSNAKTISGNVAENGYGLWVRPYVLIDNGSGEEDQAVLKYGEPEFVYLESHVLSKVTTDLTSSESEVANKVRLTATSTIDKDSSGNNFYPLVETGFVFDRDGVITSEADAKKNLVLDSEFNVRGLAQNETTIDITDTGNGIWAVGYTTVKFINGDTVTNYSDPIYWAVEEEDPLEGVSVTVDTKTVNDVKFEFDVTADGGDYEVVKTGLIYDKSGTVNNVEENVEQNVADSLKVGSVYYDENYSAADSAFAMKVSDAGNGIWYVGYVTVNVDGVEMTKYSAPQYVYSEVQTEGVDMHMAVTERGKNASGNDSYRFATISRVSKETPIESGIIFNRDGNLTTKTAKDKLVLTSEGRSTGNIVARKTEGTITSCIADIGDHGNGIWFVSYIITEDANGNRTTTYTEPRFVDGHESAVRANLSVKVASSLREGSTNSYRIDGTAVTGEYNVDRVGIIFSRSGEVTEANAASLLTLNDGGASDKTITEKAGVNSTGGNITDKGNGIWVVGYVIVQVSDTETVTQYSDPVFVGNN